MYRLFWAGMTVLCITWTYFRLPETKDFTFAEIDRLFEQGVPARKFTEYRGKLTVTTHSQGKIVLMEEK